MKHNVSSLFVINKIQIKNRIWDFYK